MTQAVLAARLGRDRVALSFIEQAKVPLGRGYMAIYRAALAAIVEERDGRSVD